MGWTSLRRPEPELEPTVVVEPPPPVQPATPASQPVLPVAAPAKAWVEHGRIVLDAPIAFEPGSAILLPASLPLLSEVAAVVHDYPQIELMVVQGHADELGSLGADYELSLRRARVVFEGLVERAVRPERVSYRGMGSTQPQAPCGPRGVELIITRVRPLQAGRAPVEERDILLPWSGEALAAGVPGDKLLGVDGHPILEVQALPQPQQLDDIPSGESFRQALEEQDRLEPQSLEAP